MPIAPYKLLSRDPKGRSQTETELLTNRWTQLRHHAEQQRLVDSPARFKVVPAGRRSGKTERAKRRLVEASISGESEFANPNYFAAAPTRDQAKRIYWDDLKTLSPRWSVRKTSETELSIWYVTGAMLSVVGMDKPQRIEGSPWDGGVLDEYANMKPEAWGENVRPALSDRFGWAWLIGVPEGRNHYYDTYNNALGPWNVSNGGEWDSFAWLSSDILPAAEIESARATLDELTFQQEYEASFVNFEGQAYYPFDRAFHCAGLRENYNPKADLVFCFDFNVDPGTATIIQEMEFPRKIAIAETVNIKGKQFFKNVAVPATTGTGVIGEVYIPRNSNTEAVCNKLVKDWGEHAGRIFIYGDATGGARGSAQTEGSDWDLVKKSLYGHYGPERVHFRVPSSNPTERARINAVNTRLKSGAGNISLMVDPVFAPMVVKDFEGVRLLAGGGGELDKKADPKLTHLTDGIGYYIARQFPLLRKGPVIQQVHL
jgi:hypothetical protein